MAQLTRCRNSIRDNVESVQLWISLHDAVEWKGKGGQFYVVKSNMEEYFKGKPNYSNWALQTSGHPSGQSWSFNMERLFEAQTYASSSPKPKLPRNNGVGASSSRMLARPTALFSARKHHAALKFQSTCFSSSSDLPQRIQTDWGSESILGSTCKGQPCEFSLGNAFFQLIISPLVPPWVETGKKSSFCPPLSAASGGPEGIPRWPP